METLNLYEFNELNDVAQKRAIEEMRNRCYEENSNLDFNDAFETKRKIIKLAGVVPSYYGFAYASPNELYNKTLADKFTIFMDKVDNNFAIDTIFDSIIKDIIDEWDFSKETDYLETIGYIIIELDEIVTTNTYRYKEDECVINYIKINDKFRFLEDGRFIEL